MSGSMPISKLKTQAAKDEVANYLRMGLKKDELAFVMDGDTELVVTNKTGLIKLMKAVPIGRAEALRRIQGKRLVNHDGSPTDSPTTMREFITLEDELELFRDEV